MRVNRVNRVTRENKREKWPARRGNPHPPPHRPLTRSLTAAHTHTHVHTHAPASVFFVSPVSSFPRRRRPREESGGGGGYGSPPHAPRALPRETEHHRRDMSVAGSESPNCWGSDSVDRSFKIKKNENFFSVHILCTFHRARRVVDLVVTPRPGV